jgi:zinc protease
MSANLVWRRKILPNGLVVLLYPSRSANTSQLSVAVKYGSIQEPTEQAGVAHFLEHMLAGGSDKRIELSRSVEDSGGVLDFYTDREYILGTVDVLPHKLTDASAILSELFFDDSFDEKKFVTEQKIILHELAEVGDDPATRTEELLLEGLYKQHPIKRPVGGYPKTVKKLSLNQLRQEHQANYVPGNMVLVLTGSYTEKDAELVLKDFSGVKGNFRTQNKAYPLETFTPKPSAVEEKAGLTQTYLSIGARTVCSTHPDAPALDLISIILGGGTSSRLFIELRERHAVTYDVDSSYSKGFSFGYFSINCAANQRTADKAKNLIFKELGKLRSEPVPNGELERAKQIMVGGILRGMDNPETMLDILTFIEIQFGDEHALESYLEKRNALTNEDIQTVAAKYLNQNCLCAAELKPI